MSLASFFLFFGYGLSVRTQKVKNFDLPPCEYVAIHFGTYPSSIPPSPYRPTQNHSLQKKIK